MWMGLCTAFVFAALVEFTIVNFWFRKHRKRKENALALMLPFVSTASNLTAATQMSAATKTENTMRANQKKVKTSFKNSYFSFFLLLYTVSHLLSMLIERKSIQFSISKDRKRKNARKVYLLFLLAIEWKLSLFNSFCTLPLLYSFKKVAFS